ncbi:hypothetical protein T492DRAFT_867610 [Pavlovales sp. CCMP2436]|nr:hypothetical protein T492DRAFT_867610 [Pavlovales sp. CCMP2436]
MSTARTAPAQLHGGGGAASPVPHPPARPPAPPVLLSTPLAAPPQPARPAVGAAQLALQLSEGDDGQTERTELTQPTHRGRADASAVPPAPPAALTMLLAAPPPLPGPPTAPPPAVQGTDASRAELSPGKRQRTSNPRYPAEPATTPAIVDRGGRGARGRTQSAPILRVNPRPLEGTPAHKRKRPRADERAAAPAGDAPAGDEAEEGTVDWLVGLGRPPTTEDVGKCGEPVLAALLNPVGLSTVTSLQVDPAAVALRKAMRTSTTKQTTLTVTAEPRLARLRERTERFWSLVAPGGGTLALRWAALSPAATEEECMLFSPASLMDVLRHMSTPAQCAGYAALSSLPAKQTLVMRIRDASIRDAYKPRAPGVPAQPGLAAGAAAAPAAATAPHVAPRLRDTDQLAVRAGRKQGDGAAETYGRYLLLVALAFAVETLHAMDELGEATGPSEEATRADIGAVQALLGVIDVASMSSGAIKAQVVEAASVTSGEIAATNLVKGAFWARATSKFDGICTFIAASIFNAASTFNGAYITIMYP